MPAGFQAWLFGTATRVLEAVSGLGLSGYAAVFALAPDEIYAWRIYYKFQDIPEAWTVGVLAAAGLLQTALLFARGVPAFEHGYGRSAAVGVFLRAGGE